MFMLFVVEGTSGLPFECAGHVSGSTRRHSFIVCGLAIKLFASSVFILVYFFPKSGIGGL